MEVKVNGIDWGDDVINGMINDVIISYFEFPFFFLFSCPPRGSNSFAYPNIMQMS